VTPEKDEGTKNMDEETMDTTGKEESLADESQDEKMKAAVDEERFVSHKEEEEATCVVDSSCDKLSFDKVE
jgi:hypothetical protein